MAAQELSYIRNFQVNFQGYPPLQTITERYLSMKFKLTALEKQWILYDVGNSAFILLVSTIIPIYFNYLADNANISSVNYLAYWGYAASISTILVALIGPIAGTISDTRSYRKNSLSFPLASELQAVLFLVSFTPGSGFWEFLLSLKLVILQQIFFMTLCSPILRYLNVWIEYLPMAMPGAISEAASLLLQVSVWYWVQANWDSP